MRLTPTQIEQLLSVLDKYTWTFLAHHVGVDTLTQNQTRTLQLAGIGINDITKTAYNVEHAFKFGIISDAIGDAAAKKMNYDQLKASLETGRAFRMSAAETSALKSLKFQTASEIVKLGSKVKDDIKNTLVQADLKRSTIKHHSIVTDAAKKAIEDRRYIKEVVSEIGHRTGAWEKDLGKISDYVLHQAFDEGRAMVAVREGGDDALVYKDVYPGACPHCTKLYLVGGVGSQPIVFKVSELKANGTNIGVKQVDWKAVIGALHPWCRCTLQKVPLGMTIKGLREGKWIWEGGVFRLAPNTGPRRDRPRAKVTIG